MQNVNSQISWFEIDQHFSALPSPSKSGLRGRSSPFGRLLLNGQKFKLPSFLIKINNFKLSLYLSLYTMLKLKTILNYIFSMSKLRQGTYLRFLYLDVNLKKFLTFLRLKVAGATLKGGCCVRDCSCKLRKENYLIF